MTTPDGKFAGTNLITRPLGQCVVQEHWVGSQCGKGERYNAYDATRGMWHQPWWTTVERFCYRITWTPVDSAQVRQLWESRTDGGMSWGQLFLGIHRPRQK